MGLFGYGKGDFEKNTGVFKQRVNNLLFSMNRLNNAQAYGIGPALNGIIFTLDEVKYTKKNGKEQNAIDERMFKLIDSMERDLQKKNAGSFSEHMRMLGEAVDDSRRYGQEAYTADELQAQEKMAIEKGHICDALNQKGEIDKQKELIVKRIKKLLVEGKKAEVQKLELEFQAYKSKEATLNESITAHCANYNLALQVGQIKERSKLTAELKANKIVENPAAFARETERVNLALAEQLGVITESQTIATEALNADVGFSNLNTGTGEATALAESELAREASETINGASYEGVNGAMDPDLLKELNS